MILYSEHLSLIITNLFKTQPLRVSDLRRTVPEGFHGFEGCRVASSLQGYSLAEVNTLSPPEVAQEHIQNALICVRGLKSVRVIHGKLILSW